MKLIFENWRRYLNESRVVTFDFDDTLTLSKFDEKEGLYIYVGAQEHFLNKLKKHKKDGDIIYIVTSRHEEREGQHKHNISIEQFISDFNLSSHIHGVYFTNGKPKINTLINLGAEIHHDDDIEDITDAREKGIEAIVSDPYGDYGL